MDKPKEIMDKPKEITEEFEDYEKMQEDNETIANVPDEFKVDGKVVKIYSRTLNELPVIDREVLKLQKHIFSIDLEEAEEEEDVDVYDQAIEAQKKRQKLVVNVLYNIINRDYDNPEFGKEWISKHIDVETANNILDAYNKKNATGDLVKKMAMARKL